MVVMHAVEKELNQENKSTKDLFTTNFHDFYCIQYNTAQDNTG